METRPPDDRIADLVLGELPEAERAAVEEAASVGPAAARRRELEETIGALRAWQDRLAALPEPPIPARPVRDFGPLVAIAAGLAVFVLLGLLMSPCLLRSKISANETSVVKSMQVICEAEEEYRLSEGGVYGTLAQMSACTPPMIDAQLGNGTKSGYLFILQVYNNGNSFTCRGDPRVPGETGNRYFWGDESQLIRHRVGGPADANDPVIDG